MEDFETMVENEDFDNEADDALPEEVVEETGESEEESLESLADEEADEGQAEEQEQQPQASEPKWMQKRISKAVDKALSRERESIRAEMEARYAPIRERLLEMDAQELFKSGKVKDIELAREIVRYRQNAPQAPAAEPTPQPRNEHGQFTSATDPEDSVRVNMWAHQADKIREETGLDVISVFSKNEDIRQAVLNDEMDMYDVAKMMQSDRRRAPAPMRSPNGAVGSNPNAIDTMSDEQFDRMEDRISKGARYSLK